jgi:putative endonuclease
MLGGLKQLVSRAFVRVGRLLGRNSHAADEPATLHVGRRGEREAARHLRQKGYRILERNFRTRLGEIDLVAFRSGTVAFVEVRTQTWPTPIDPLHTITRQKQRRVIKASQKYCTLRGLEDRGLALRYDVVTVLLEKDGAVRSIHHLENAFQNTPRTFT